MSFWKPDSISGFEDGMRFATGIPAFIGMGAVLLAGLDIVGNTVDFEWASLIKPGSSEFAVLAGVIALLPHAVLLTRAYNAGYLAISPEEAQASLWERIRTGKARNPHT